MIIIILLGVLQLFYLIYVISCILHFTKLCKILDESFVDYKMWKILIPFYYWIKKPKV